MLPSDFVAPGNGELVPIVVQVRPDVFEDGWAYVPKPLPPTLPLDWKLVEALDRASTELALLVGQVHQHQNATLFTRPLLFREAGESSRIEGIQTRAADVLLQEAGVGPQAAGRQRDDNVEVLRYLEALRDGEHWIQQGSPITEFLIRNLHERLLRDTRGADKHPGQFRRRQVWIGNKDDTPRTARYVPPPWEQVQPAIQSLVAFIAPEHRTLPPLVVSALLHYQFEAIHPFEDGNGRLGRLILPLYLMTEGLLDRAILVLSPYFEAHRDTYMSLLQRVSTHGDWSAWILFFLEAVRVQANQARALITRIEDLRQRYRERIATSRTTGIYPALDFIVEDVIVTPRAVAEKVQVSLNTARSILNGLREQSIIEQIPGMKTQHWWAKELIDVAYERDPSS